MRKNLPLVALLVAVGFWSRRSEADTIAGYVVSGHVMASGYGWAMFKIAVRNTPPIPNGTVVTITIPIDLDEDVAHLMVEALATTSARYTTFYGLTPDVGAAGFYHVTPSTTLDITGLSQIQVFGVVAGTGSMVRIQIFSATDYWGLVQVRASDGTIATVALRRSPYPAVAPFGGFDPMPPDQVRNVVAMLGKPWASFTFDHILGAGIASAANEFHADSRLWYAF